MSLRPFRYTFSFTRQLKQAVQPLVRVPVAPRGSWVAARRDAVLSLRFHSVYVFRERQQRSARVIRQYLFHGFSPTFATPNHALQRTRAAVTPAASGLRLAPATQRSRQPRGSLSLGSLGVLAHLP